MGVKFELVAFVLCCFLLGTAAQPQQTIECIGTSLIKHNNTTDALESYDANLCFNTSCICD